MKILPLAAPRTRCGVPRGANDPTLSEGARLGGAQGEGGEGGRCIYNKVAEEGRPRLARAHCQGTCGAKEPYPDLQPMASNVPGAPALPQARYTSGHPVHAQCRCRAAPMVVSLDKAPSRTVYISPQRKHCIKRYTYSPRYLCKVIPQIPPTLAGSPRRVVIS